MTEHVEPWAHKDSVEKKLLCMQIITHKILLGYYFFISNAGFRLLDHSKQTH